MLTGQPFQCSMSLGHREESRAAHHLCCSDSTTRSEFQGLCTVPSGNRAHTQHIPVFQIRPCLLFLGEIQITVMIKTALDMCVTGTVYMTVIPPGVRRRGDTQNPSNSSLNMFIIIYYSTTLNLTGVPPGR